jgi:ActD protein
MAERTASASPWGVMAEFATPEALLAAAIRCRREFTDVDAYSPFAVDGLADALGFTRNGVAATTLAGGVLGGAGAYFLQWYTAVIDYPINAGGRPLHSWPSFIPATFELTVLGAALAAFAGFLLLSGLPQLNHPVFDVPDFDLASKNRFFLCVRASDPAFDAARVERLFAELDPVRVMPAGGAQP